jgi:hypothetical protein
MRQSRSTVLFLFLSLLSWVAVAGCGGGGDSTEERVPAKVELAVTSQSVTRGDTTSLAAVVRDQNDAVIQNIAVTFQSSNTAALTISPAGLVCAGVWDTNFIVCNKGPVAVVEVTAKADNVTSTPVKIFVHEKVEQVVIDPPSVDCKSQADTQDFTARALNNTLADPDITATVGPMTWSSTSTVIVTVESTGNAASKATAKNPGRASILASVSGTQSLPASFATCPVETIDLKVKDEGTTDFTIAKGATKQLEATLVDTQGVTLTGVPILYHTSNTRTAPVGAAGGLVTAQSPGHAGFVASCSGGCNVGQNPVYSNLVTATVEGEASSTTVYAATTTAPPEGEKAKLVPIDTSNNTAGTAIELPATPNSLLVDADGQLGYAGSSSGLMILNFNNNTVATTVAAAKGKVLASAPNNSAVVVSDTAAGKVFIVEPSGTLQATLNIPNATAAAFNVDGVRAFIVSGSTLYVYSLQHALRQFALASPANDVSALANGSFVYLAGGAASDDVAVRAVCDLSAAGSVDTNGAPELIAPLVRQTALVAVNSPDIEVISATTDLSGGCPPTVGNTLSSASFGQAFAPKQLILLRDDSLAFITSDLPGLLVYDIAGGTTDAIALAGNAVATTGGATLDSTTLFVGGSDNKVHRIDVATRTDTNQIDVPFTPDLVVVRPR